MQVHSLFNQLATKGSIVINALRMETHTNTYMEPQKHIEIPEK